MWVLDTAKQTFDRITAIEAGEDQNSNLAKEHYSTDTNFYRQIIKKALESLKEKQ